MTSKEMTEKLATVKNLEVRLENVEENPGGFKAEEGDLDLIRWCLGLTKGLIEMLLEGERKKGDV